MLQDDAQFISISFLLHGTPVLMYGCDSYEMGFQVLLVTAPDTTPVCARDKLGYVMYDS